MSNTSLYIISDVHGCYKTLLALINQLPSKQNSNLVFVGDLVDRGKYSAKVVSFVKDGGYSCIVGNHEQMMINALNALDNGDKSSKVIKFWESRGGDITNYSYGKNIDLLKRHLQWMQQLPFYLEYNIPDTTGKTLFITHGFGLPYWEQREKEHTSEAFIWERLSAKEIIKTNYLSYPVFNVFGHDVQENSIPLINENYAAIDTGCVYGGKLCALEWPNKRVYLQTNIE